MMKLKCIFDILKNMPSTEYEINSIHDLSTGEHKRIRMSELLLLKKLKFHFLFFMQILNKLNLNTKQYISIGKYILFYFGGSFGNMDRSKLRCRKKHSDLTKNRNFKVFFYSTQWHSISVINIHIDERRFLWNSREIWFTEVSAPIGAAVL